MTMTARYLTTGLAVALTAALAVTVVAQDRPAPPDGPRQQRLAGPMGGAFANLRGLDLTDAQREQIRALLTTRREADRPAAAILELRQQLRAAVLADTPDLAQIETLKSAIAEADAKALAARVDLEMQIAQILTPEQRAKAREMPARAGRGPGGRGGQRPLRP